MRLLRVCTPIAVLLVACGGSPEPPPAAPTAPPAPPPAAASPTAEAPPPKPEPDPERLAPIVPLSAADQKEFKTKCPAFSKAVEKAAAKRSGPPVLITAEAFKEVAAAPIPGMKDDVKARCAELFEHDLRGYLVDTMRVGAVGNLGVLAHLMDQALARGGKLCPSASPIPRKFEVLAQGVYTPSADDFADRGWTCLENAKILDHLLAQIRITTDEKTGTVTLVARTMPFRDGKMVEYAREGRVEGLAITWGKPEVR